MVISFTSQIIWDNIERSEHGDTMIKGEEIKNFFRIDNRAKVSFALVAVLVLMLSTISVVYIAYINRVEQEREREAETTSIMENKITVAQDVVETQAYVLAMDAIYRATQDENDQNRIIPIFEESFKKYLKEEGYTEGDGYEEGGYYIKIENYTVSLSLDSKITDDFLSVINPDSSGGGILEGMDEDMSDLDGISVNNSETNRSAPTNVYYNLDGEIRYRAVHRDSRLAMDKNMTFSKTIKTPYPVLQTKFSQFDSYAKSGSSELGRMIQYILTTIAQYRVIQGYGSLDIEGSNIDYGGTNEIITEYDIELAVNLAILLETAKLYRDYDAEHLGQFDKRQIDLNMDVGTPMGSLLGKWIKEDQIDAADIVAIYNEAKGDHIKLNLEVLLGQAIYALMDQFVMKYFHYFHLIDLMDVLWQGFQIGMNVIDDFFGWVTDVFTDEEEKDERAEITKKWVREQLEEAELDTSIMYDREVSIERKDYEVGFLDDGTCPHLEDADGDGDKDDSVDYRWTVGSKYTVIIPTSTETADFEEMDILREENDDIWINFYEKYFNDEKENIVLTISETLKLISLKIAEDFTSIDGLEGIINECNKIPVGAINASDDVTLLETIRNKIGKFTVDVVDFFKSDKGRDGIRNLIENLVSEQNKLLDALNNTLRNYFDEFADKEENIEAATLALTETLLDNAVVRDGNGNIVKVDNPEEIKYPDLPPEPEPAEPGRLPRNVPYIHQVYDTPNWFNGNWACGPASSMMAFAYYDKLPEWDCQVSLPYEHTSHWGRYICEEYTVDNNRFNIVSNDPSGTPSKGGYGYVWQHGGGTWRPMVEYAQKHGFTSYADWTPTWGELTTEIDAGHPVVLLTSLTDAGHYVLAVGYDTDRHVVIVNDPYGNKNQVYMNYNGAEAEYDWPGYNYGNANLNTLHCFIYIKGDVPGTRSRGDVTPDEWQVMQCPYDEHPPLDADSLPKKSESRVLDEFRSVWRGDVEAYARSLVQTAYDEVKKEELERFEDGIDSITRETEKGILGIIVDTVADLGHASGLIPAACAMVSTVAMELMNSTKTRNINYFLPLSMGVPFSFWSGDVEKGKAQKNGAIHNESIEVDIKPNYLKYEEDGTGDIMITKSEPWGVHYTSLAEFHTRPFETTWNISVEGEFTLITKSEQKNLEFDGQHLAVGKNDTIEIDLSVPITVYSGWNLEGIDYECSDTLLGDIIKFLSFIWEGIKEVVGWLIDGLMKALTVLVNIIHAIVNFASKIIKVIVDIFTWVIEKIQKFIQDCVDILAKVIMGVSYILGDQFNCTVFGIVLNVTTKFDNGDIPAEGWKWKTRISARVSTDSFGFGFDLNVVQKNGTDDYDILITSGLKIGGFILEVAVDPLMAVWPRFIEGHGIYLNETGKGWGIDFTSPEIDTGWSALGSIKFDKGSIKKVIKIPGSKITIPGVGTAQAELGIKLKWDKKVPLDAKKVAPLLNRTFYEVWTDLGGRFPMDSKVIDVYSQKLLEKFKDHVVPALINITSMFDLEIWLKLTIKPFGGRFKLGGLSGYTVWTTTLKFKTDLGKDMVKNIEYFKAYTQKYLDDQRNGKKEPEKETGIDVTFSTQAKVHIKKIFSSPVTIPLIGVQAKGEVGFSISCKYSSREEVTQAWKNIRSQLNADWEAAKAGKSMENMADKAKGIITYLGKNVEFKLWMKLHLSKSFGSYGDLASTINIEFSIKNITTVIDGLNWVKDNVKEYFNEGGFNDNANATMTPPPDVKIKVYINTELGLKHKVAKIPVPAIGCTADVTIGFKFTLKFRETTNLSNFIDFMNGSFDAVDNETNSTPKDQNLITIYAQKIILKFKQAMDYILDNGQISFYVRFDLDVGGLDAVEAGVVLKFKMKCSLRGLWEVAKWIMGSVGAFINNILNPANVANYPDVPKEYLEKILIEFEAFVQVGTPDIVKDITAGMLGVKVRLSAIVSCNLPMIAAVFGQDWGRFVARFGVVLKIDLTLKIGIKNLFDFMDAEMHPHAWFRLWFFHGRIYEIE